MIVEEKPLHEVILDIMFFENIDKPASFTPEDIFWRMKDPEISERQITEVLEWLVREKKVEKRFGKFQIDKYEFVDISNKTSDEEIVEEVKKKNTQSEKKVNVVKNITIKKATQNKQSTETISLKTLVNIYYLISAFLILFLVYTGYSLLNDTTKSFDNIKITSQKQENLPKLYVSSKLNPDKKFYRNQIKDISFSFVQQTKYNTNLNDEINKLNKNCKLLSNRINDLNSIYIKQKNNYKNAFIRLGSIFIFFVILTSIIQRYFLLKNRD